jgi:hypothetical protein
MIDDGTHANKGKTTGKNVEIMQSTLVIISNILQKRGICSQQFLI